MVAALAVTALILSFLALLVACGCLVLLLAKRFSTHRVQYVHAPVQDTQVEWELPPDVDYSSGEPVITPRPPTRMSMADEARRRELDEAERALEREAADLDFE
jgi:hypothetical protein